MQLAMSPPPPPPPLFTSWLHHSVQLLHYLVPSPCDVPLPSCIPALCTHWVALFIGWIPKNSIHRAKDFLCKQQLNSSCMNAGTCPVNTLHYEMTSYLTGPRAPVVPVVERSVPDSTQAQIRWLVTSIEYTAETYQVESGVSSDALTMRSEVVNGSTNLTNTNLLYSASITGLRPFTQYHYRIVASNSYATSQTAVQMFRTTEAGIFNVKVVWSVVPHDQKSGVGGGGGWHVPPVPPWFLCLWIAL